MNIALRTSWFDALNRLTNRLDGLGPRRYTYAVPGNGVHTVTEGGSWAADEVTVTHRFGNRTGLGIAQPAGAFVVTNAWDAAGQWAGVDGFPGTPNRQGALVGRLPAFGPWFPGLPDAGEAGAIKTMGLTGGRSMPQ